MRLRFLMLAAAIAAAPLAVGAQTPGKPDPGAVQPGVYKVEPDHTQVQFGVNHLGFTEYFGRFSGAAGSLSIDPRQPGAARLDISVPTASVSTTSTKLNEELRGADWLDAAQFPDIRFRSTRVTPTGPGAARVDGELTLHGVTRPATLEARFVGAGVNPLDKAYTVGFQAAGVIRRSEFGVTKYVPLVSDEVRLTLSGAFEKTAEKMGEKTGG